MSEFYRPAGDELMHYGVKGMKWGIRRRTDAEKLSYRRAKKDIKSAKKEYKRNVGLGIGINGIAKATKAEAKLKAAETDFIMKKAKYKAAGRHNSEKAERKFLTNEMYKRGLPGSIRDEQTRGRSTMLYDRIKKDKGKKYADDIMKRTQRKSVTELATAAVVGVGAMAVSAYLNAR